MARKSGSRRNAPSHERFGVPQGGRSARERRAAAWVVEKSSRGQINPNHRKPFKNNLVRISTPPNYLRDNPEHPGAFPDIILRLVHRQAAREALGVFGSKEALQEVYDNIIAESTPMSASFSEIFPRNKGQLAKIAVFGKPDKKTSDFIEAETGYLEQELHIGLTSINRIPLGTFNSTSQAGQFIDYLADYATTNALTVDFAKIDQSK